MDPFVAETLAEVQVFAARLTEAGLNAEHTPAVRDNVVYNLLDAFEQTLHSRRSALRSHRPASR